MEKKKPLVSLLSAFAITSLVMLAVRFGAEFVLYMIGSFELSREVLVIYTSILYGIVFFIARIGARSNKQRSVPDITDYGQDDNETKILFKKSPIKARVRTFLWVFFGAFSVFCLTPGLVIYWSSPIHPEKITAVLGSFFGLASAAIYFAVKNERFPKIIDRLFFLIGTFLGLSIGYCLNT
jgi:hypothetical protein